MQPILHAASLNLVAALLQQSFSRGIKALLGLICAKYGNAETARAIHRAAEDRHLADCLGAGLVA